MASWATDLILWCMGIYAVLVLIDAFIRKTWKALVINLVLLGLVFLVLALTTDFPDKPTSFGGVTPVLAILIMFAATCLGMAAWYFRTARKPRWINLFKTLVLSPIVLVPMIGTVQGAETIEPIQMFTLRLLAFQNGFFWKTILDQAKKQLASPQPTEPATTGG